MTTDALRARLARVVRGGSDGLSARQRRKRASRWAESAARTPSRDEARELLALARQKQFLRKTG